MSSVYNKQEALSQIANLAREYDISAQEILGVIASETAQKKEGSSIALRIFSILGGIFIFSGISIYIGMQWASMNSAMRVIITLGSGFVAYILAVIFSREESKGKFVAPLFLIAAILETGGLFVLIDEYFSTNSHDVNMACLIVFGIMLAQQGFTFLSMRFPVLLFTTMWFGSCFFATAFDRIGVSENWNAISVGASLLFIAYGLKNSIYGRILQLAYFFGSIFVLYAAFDLLKDNPLYLALTAFMIYMSITARSTTMLIISVLAMLSYIGYFTAEHFVNSVGWPVSLIVLGLVFYGIGVGAVKLKKKYIKQ